MENKRVNFEKEEFLESELSGDLARGKYCEWIDLDHSVKEEDKEQILVTLPEHVAQHLMFQNKADENGYIHQLGLYKDENKEEIKRLYNMASILNQNMTNQRLLEKITDAITHWEEFYNQRNK